MATAQSIIEQILRDSGLDPGSTLVTEVKARLFDYMNEVIATLNVTGKFNVLKKAGTITLVSGTDTYSIASDAQVTRITGERFYINSDQRVIGKVDDITFQNLLMTGDLGLPEFWRPFGASAGVHQVQFYPKPTTGQAGKIASYNYQQILTKLSAPADVTPIEDVLISLGTKKKYYEYDEDFGRADRMERSYMRVYNAALAANRGSIAVKPRFK